MNDAFAFYELWKKETEVGKLTSELEEMREYAGYLEKRLESTKEKLKGARRAVINAYVGDESEVEMYIFNLGNNQPIWPKADEKGEYEEFNKEYEEYMTPFRKGIRNVVNASEYVIMDILHENEWDPYTYANRPLYFKFDKIALMRRLMEVEI